MNKNITSLVNIAGKEKRLIIGLMSGTSLDGLDVALCEISGSGINTKTELLQFTTVPYDAGFRNEVKEIFSRDFISLEKLCLLNEWIGSKHASYVNNCLKQWDIDPAKIDLIASHGQTVYHAPKRLHSHEKFGNATLQIGDGDHIAVGTGIITISDFRQKNIAAGAEGAPLAAYGDRLVFGKQGEDSLLLNIGGIANFTWLPGNMQKIFSSDTGPGNTMMDAFIQQHFPGKYFDENAEVASTGMVNETLLAALKDHDFFRQEFPKTTGPELFNLDYLQQAIKRSGTATISVEDTMRTLNQFSADCIAAGIKDCVGKNPAIKIFVSGGGIHNPLLMENLKSVLPGCTFETTGAMGINPDAKEAVLFALLANECICGNLEGYTRDQPSMPAISMGKISFPY